MYRAFESTNATDEQKAKVLNEVTNTMRGVTEKDFKKLIFRKNQKLKTPRLVNQRKRLQRKIM